MTAASRLFHRHGYAAVSLRDVASAADVPPGGIYYHYRSKGALACAVAEARHAASLSMLERVAETERTPAAQLRALAEALAATASVSARYGCASARLIADLSGGNAAERRARATVVESQRAVERFVADTLRRAGRPERVAHRGARRFMVIWQGASALAQAEQDPAILTKALTRAPREVMRIE